MPCPPTVAASLRRLPLDSRWSPNRMQRVLPQNASNGKRRESSLWILVSFFQDDLSSTMLHSCTRLKLVNEWWFVWHWGCEECGALRQDARKVGPSDDSERERDWHQGFHVEMEYTILAPLKVNTPLLFCSVLAPCAPYALVHSASAAAHGFSPKTWVKPFGETFGCRVTTVVWHWVHFFCMYLGVPFWWDKGLL